MTSHTIEAGFTYYLGLLVANKVGGHYLGGPPIAEPKIKKTRQYTIKQKLCDIYDWAKKNC